MKQKRERKGKGMESSDWTAKIISRFSAMCKIQAAVYSRTLGEHHVTLTTDTTLRCWSISLRKLKTAVVCRAENVPAAVVS